MATHLMSLLLILLVTNNVVTGNKHIGCFVEGECAMFIDHSNLVEIIEDVVTPEDCLGKCKMIEDCLYFTHFQVKEACYLYSSCQYFFYECQSNDCISGESSCNPPFLKEFNMEK